MSDNYMPVQTTAHRSSFVFAYQIDEVAPDCLRSQAARLQGHLQCLRLDVLLQEGTWPAVAGDAPLWTPLSREHALRALHTDLSPVADSLLNGHGPNAEREGESAYHGHPPLKLSSEALAQRFSVRLGAAASARLERLGLAHYLTVLGAEIEQGRLHTFASGIVLLVLDLRFIQLGDSDAALPLPLIEEAVYALSHPADRQQTLHAVEIERRVVLQDLAPGDQVVLDEGARFGLRRASADELAADAQHGPQRLRKLLRAVTASSASQPTLLLSPSARPFDLQALAARLVAISGDGHVAHGLRELSSRQHGRVFSFTVAVCPADSSRQELDEAAYRLSRRFNSEYAIERSHVEPGLVHTFDNIVHAMAIQGGALVLRATGAKFVDGYLNAAARPTYLPLALLSYHEYLYLLHLTQGCAFIPDPAHPDKDKKRIQSLRYQLAKFRLYFRFSHISDISHHNRVHEAWRKAFALDRMLQDLSLDVREADQVLEHHHQEEQKRRWRISGALLGGLAGFLAMHEIVDVLRDLNHADYKVLMHAILGGAAGPAEAVRLDKVIHTWHIVGVAVSVAAGIGAGVVAWLKGPRLEE